MSTLAVKKVKLGGDADLNKNFVIEVPAVADGTLSIKREDGTLVMSFTAANKAVIHGVVGTVSQSGGIPTGQVVERGSNANGEYVRFADGTQICTGVISSSEAIGTAFWGAFRSTGVIWTFPAVFVVAPAVTAICRAVATAFGVTGGGQASVTEGNYVFTSITTQTAATRTAEVTAIGRWF